MKAYPFLAIILMVTIIKQNQPAMIAESEATTSSKPTTLNELMASHGAKSRSLKLTQFEKTTTAPLTLSKNNFVTQQQSICQSFIEGSLYESYSSAELACEKEKSCIGIAEDQCDKHGPFHLCKI